MLSEELVSLLPAFVANVRGKSIGPSKTQIVSMAQRAGLPDPADSGKEILVRSILMSAVDEHLGAGEKFVKMFVNSVRGSGGFNTSDENYAGASSVARLQAAFGREGWVLTDDGELRPKVFDNLDGKELAEAFAALVRRAQRGADDYEVVIGTSKCLEEAVARHVLTEVSGGYSHTMDFLSTLHLAFDRLGLETPATQDRLHKDPYKELEIAIHLLGRAVNRLRNDRGDGHGRPADSIATALESRLSAISSGLVCELLLEGLQAHRS